MLFNSYVFVLLFFPIVYGVYKLLQLPRGKRYFLASKAWLVLASLFFYGYFKPEYLPIIIASIGVNYLIGNSLLNKQGCSAYRRLLLSIGCVFNVGILVFYKYSNFLLENFNQLFSTEIRIPIIEDIVLPLGISFYTFQQLSYIVDCYHNQCQKYNLLDYSLFVTFFPQLIAGPIVLPSEMLPQFNDEKNRFFSWENINEGAFLFACGLAKKTFVADTFAIIADVGFSTSLPLRFADAWLISLAYTLQLYFDFSGYCDMAMGIGKAFNINLPLNFNSPYKATDFQDFWRRWHITLGRFMMNYLYIPLGGNRKGTVRTYVNLFTVFVVSGLWHGAGWLFLIWGALHGVGIIVHRIWRSAMKKWYHGFALPRWFSRLITFLCVNILWVFFRAETLKSAIQLLKYMFGSYSWKLNISRPFKRALEGAGNLPKGFLVWSVIICLGIVLFMPNAVQLCNFLKKKPRLMAILTGVLAWIGFVCISRMSPFLYFNF